MIRHWSSAPDLCIINHVVVSHHQLTDISNPLCLLDSVLQSRLILPLKNEIEARHLLALLVVEPSDHEKLLLRLELKDFATPSLGLLARRQQPLRVCVAFVILGVA